MSGIFTAQSGQPFTIFNGIDRVGVGGPKQNPSRPNLIQGGNPDPVIGSLTQWYDPSQFAVQPFGTFGNLGRNTAVGPTLRTVNLALLKRTAIHKISEQFNLEFRAEVNNAFNHPNYAIPNANLYIAGTGGNVAPNSQAGRITALLGGAGVGYRQVLLALKATF